MTIQRKQRSKQRSKNINNARKPSKRKKQKIKINNLDLKALRKVQSSFRKPKTDEEIFYYLCFCIMAPQTTFKNNRRSLNGLINLCFYKFDFKEHFIGPVIRSTRFYRNKAKNLVALKKVFPLVLKCVRSKQQYKTKREFLVKNVRGLGYKTASHFLRNMGAQNLAVIDTHVLKFMEINC